MNNIIWKLGTSYLLDGSFRKLSNQAKSAFDWHIPSRLVPAGLCALNCWEKDVFRPLGMTAQNMQTYLRRRSRRGLCQ